MTPIILGACKRCDAQVYDVLAVHQSGPQEGQPSRLGAMLPEGTQVEFMLSDGSECALTMCRSCAESLTPEAYQPLWDRIVALEPDVPGGRRHLAAIWPLAFVRRRWSPAPGQVEIDRR